MFDTMRALNQAEATPAASKTSAVDSLDIVWPSSCFETVIAYHQIGMALNSHPTRFQSRQDVVKLDFDSECNSLRQIDGGWDGIGEAVRWQVSIIFNRPRTNMTVIYCRRGRTLDGQRSTEIVVSSLSLLPRSHLVSSTASA
jgi:branched-subunit amino acid aminotransferase/4-amino-4-deoxychorismate lyase